MKKLLLFLCLPGVLFFACDNDEGHTIPLPANIQSYLDANYANAEIEESEADTLCTGVAVYDVELEVADDEEIELTFNTEGALLFTETEITVQELPAEVSATIAANYAGFTAEEADRLDLPDGSRQYEVELKNGQTLKEVLFNASGAVVCEQAGDDDGE